MTPTLPLPWMEWLRQEDRRRREQGLRRAWTPLRSATPGYLFHKDKLLLNFGSNDYLGLAADPRVVEAAVRATRRHGFGAGASPLVTGWREPHEALAEALADFEGAERVALFPSGYAANLGALAALTGPGDAVYADRLDHSCLIRAVRLSGASLRVYPHADAARLGQILERDRASGRFRRALIATESVFSMDGDLAPLTELADLAERYNALLLVDEAHATGVFGRAGRGGCEALGVAHRVPVRVGTLSKALGSLGGFVAGPSLLIEQIVNAAPTLVFSTALPPPAVAAASEALRIVSTEPWRRVHVHNLGDRLRSRLREAGWNVSPSVGPIVPLLVGDAEAAVALAAALREAGIVAPAIRPPTVPAGTSRLRISLTAVHNEADLEQLVRALDQARGARGPWTSPAPRRTNP